MKEREEFERWSTLISIDDQGQVGIITEEEKEKETQQFIDFIKLRKVIMLEELAAEFNMQTNAVVKKIEKLEKSDRLTGITDDRGKFIHVT